MFPDYVYFCGTPGGDFMTCPRSNWDILEFKKGPLAQIGRVLENNAKIEGDSVNMGLETALSGPLADSKPR